MTTAPKAAAPASTTTAACQHCDDTGDVHSIDGEWRGVCLCPAGQRIQDRIAATPPQQATPVWTEAMVAEMWRLADEIEVPAASPIVAAQPDLLALAVRLLAEWCHAVDHNGTSWDDWDESYKDAAYRPGPLRELIDAELAQLDADLAQQEAQENARRELSMSMFATEAEYLAALATRGA